MGINISLHSLWTISQTAAEGLCGSGEPGGNAEPGAGAHREVHGYRTAANDRKLGKELYDVKIDFIDFPIFCWGVV